MVTVTESGLFALALRSHGAVTPGTPQHRFRRWMTLEVLPAIRETRSYTLPGRDTPDQERVTSETNADIRRVVSGRRTGTYHDHDRERLVRLLFSMPGFVAFLRDGDVARREFDIGTVLIRARQDRDRIAARGRCCRGKHPCGPRFRTIV